MNDDACRREQILKAADRLLRHYGPHKTTVADVAREAKVGVGTVYLEFPSKDAIIEELSRSRYREVIGAMRAAAAAQRPFRERLCAVFDARLGAFLSVAEEGAHACDLVHCVSSAVKSAQSSFYEEELALFIDLLQKGAEAGELAVREPETVARSLLRAYVSFTPPGLFGRDADEARRAIGAMHELILHGLLRRSPPEKGRKADGSPRPRG
jgi:AcrR family transcriptional regulator